MKSDLEVYADYQRYCKAVGHVAPSFVVWSGLRDSPVEYESADVPVEPVPSTKLVRKSCFGGHLVRNASIVFPYERWESAWSPS